MTGPNVTVLLAGPVEPMDGKLLSAYTRAITEANQELRDKYGVQTCSNSVRTLFDPPSSEWKDTTMEQKFILFNLLCKRGLTLSGLLAFHVEQYKGRQDVMEATQFAVLDLLEYAIVKLGAGDRDS